MSLAKSMQEPHKFVADRSPELIPVFVDFQERLTQSCSMEFSDMLLLTLQIWRKHPEVLREYQIRYPAVVVDEFQVTK